MNASHEILRQSAAARAAAGNDAASYRAIQPPISHPSGAPVRWGKAAADWTDATGTTCPYVNVNPCEDRDGTNTDTSTTHKVWLPRPHDAAGDNAADPNVREDQVIAYVRAIDREYVAASGYLDAPIGTIRLWTDATNIPPGWYLCDGTNGTEDLRGTFVVGYDSDDADYDAIGEAGGYTWHGLTENNHPDHQDHCHSGTGQFGTLTVDANLDDTTVTLQHGEPVVDVNCEAMVLRHGGIVNACPAQTPDAESHDFADTDNRPPFTVVVFIQRVD